MVNVLTSSSAVREAGEDYQIIFRVLDLLVGFEGAELLDGLSRLSVDEIASTLTAFGCSRDADAARELVGDFVRAQDHVTDGVARLGASRILHLKRRGLIEYMRVVAQFAEQNRKLRYTQYEKADDDILAGAMTVSPPPPGRHRGPVIRAAILYKGFIWSMPAPSRHSDIINAMFDVLGGQVDSIQTDGFLTASGHFVDRIGGLKAARAARQPFMEQPVSPELFSENLW